LQLQQLKLPLSPAVVGIRVEDHVDHTGDPSLRVWVMVDEAVDAEKLSGASVSQLKSAIRQRLRENGITEFPYIILAKQSELDDSEAVTED
jgi:hypothetical protein